jgi:hypothetical protein
MSRCSSSCPSFCFGRSAANLSESRMALAFQFDSLELLLRPGPTRSAKAVSQPAEGSRAAKQSGGWFRAGHSHATGRASLSPRRAEKKRLPVARESAISEVNG